MKENNSLRDKDIFEFAPLSDFSFRRRITIRIADLFLYLLITLFGKTTRFESTEDASGIDQTPSEATDSNTARTPPPAIIFWHDNIFLQTYVWRHSDVVALVSTSFHGEIIARAAQRLGYGMIRGSSTRGGKSALADMIRLTERGHRMLITVDGPLGPRHKVKKGALVLAKETGIGLAPMVAAADRFWEFNTWDKARIPKPFAKAKLFIGKPVFVPPDADDVEIENKRRELETKLDEVVSRGEKWRVNKNKE